MVTLALNVDAQPADEGTDFDVSPQGLIGNLDPNESATVTVSFAPSAAGPAASSVVLDCPVCAARQVLLTGNGTIRFLTRGAP